MGPSFAQTMAVVSVVDGSSILEYSRTTSMWNDRCVSGICIREKGMFLRSQGEWNACENIQRKAAGCRGPRVAFLLW